MAQVRGELIVHDDVKWIRGQAGKLTKMMEAAEPVPWKMADAPRDYTETMLAQHRRHRDSDSLADRAK